MNPALEESIENLDRIMEESGEAPDGRALTSPQNGRKGGRSPLDNTAIAEAYKVHYNTSVRWWNGAFYEYDRTAGFWRTRTEKQLGARVGAFLNTKPVVGNVDVRYSRNMETNVVGALRATADLDVAPPLFLSTGKTAVGWAAMTNGLLDIEAAARGEPDALHPFTEDFFSTRHFPFAWDAAAECPLWMRFLEQVQPDPQNREMLRLLTGLLLVPETAYNVFFIFLGKGGCGMSTFLKVLDGIAEKGMEGLLGADNVCCVTLAEMAEKHTAYRLTRALANLVDDSATVDGSKFGQSLATAEGLLKRVTSGGKIHCEPKGVDPWEARAIARCVFCTNGLPPFADRSTALWDRLRVVPFNVRFRGTDEQNPHLAEDILTGELPGIFRWAVGGLGDLRRDYKVFPQSEEGQAIIDEHRSACDSERTFLEEKYHQVNGEFISLGDIYSAYAAWCRGGGRVPKKDSNFRVDVCRVFPDAVYTPNPIRNPRYPGARVRGFWNVAPIPVDEE